MSEAKQIPVLKEEEATAQVTDEVAGAKADSTDASEFSTKTWREDLTLVVEDRKLYVSKTILAVASPVFEAMFNAEFQEKGKDELVLPGKKYKHVVKFLKCIYPNTSILNPITYANVHILLPLANEYQVQSMKTACETCLLAHLSSTMRKNDKYEILQMACSYDLNEVKERCIDIIIAQPRHEFDEATTKIKFPDDIQLKIKTKALNALDVKFKDVSGRYKTSKVLNQFFGVNNTRRDLVTDFLNGYVVGDCIDLKLDSKFNAKTHISVGNIVFGISTTIGSGMDRDGKYRADTLFVDIFHGLEYTVNGLFCIVIHNWMKDIEDFKHDVLFEMNKKTRNGPQRKTIGCKSVKELTEERNGFINKGIIDCTMYLFINHSPLQWNSISQ